MSVPGKWLVSWWKHCSRLCFKLGSLLPNCFFVLFLHLNFNGLSEAWSGCVLPGSDTLAFVTLQNNDNETALHCAAQYGHTEVVKVLLEELTDPTMRNNKFETPLDLAALYGRLEVVKMLLNAHPNLLSCNTKKHTPLHLAARNGHKTVVHVLLDAGMDSNYQVSSVSVCEGLVWLLGDGEPL